MPLKRKTVHGLTWSFIDSFANQGLNFVIGIILARLLTPADFGLIGMLTFFMAISQSFIDSGFGSALIRKKNCTTEDYSTVFYYNMAVGILLYLVLFFSAQTISDFFDKPQLKAMAQVLAINLIINSVSMIQRTIRTKRIDFKSQAKISIIASIFSGVISIGMAWGGWGVWSLVWRSIIQNLCMSVLLWWWIAWRPRLLFSMASFKELFGFGSKLLISGLIDTTFKNIYYLIIGKFFSATALGYYTRAQSFSTMPSQILTGVIQRVSYPALATIQDDRDRLKRAYRKLIKSTMLLSFVSMIGMAAIAKPLVLTLIGEKWSPSIAYLQLICFAAMLYPLHALNLNMLNVKGRSDLFLRLEIIKKLLVIPTIFAGIFWGIKVMILGMLANSIVAYFLNSYWSGKMVNYPFKEQIADIAPSFLIASIIGLIIYSIGLVLPFQPAITLLIEIASGALLFWIATKIIKIDSFVEMKEIIKGKLASVFQGGFPDEEI